MLLFLLTKQLIPTVTDSNQPLSMREQEVLALIVEGLTNKEIGRRLSLSAEDANVHRLRDGLRTRA